MTDIPEHLIRRMEEERTTVRVPIAELEALRTWSETEWSRPPGAVGDLLAHLPEPEPSAPIDGYVRDTGGGVVTIVIDRDTELYPRVGERVVLTFGEPVDADDAEPQPTDGPDYHADHAAWEQRNR